MPHPDRASDLRDPASRPAVRAVLALLAALALPVAACSPALSDDDDATDPDDDDTADDDDSTPDDDDSVVDDDDDDAADDDDTVDDDDTPIDVPIEPVCDGTVLGSRVRTGVSVNQWTVGPDAGTFSWDANEPDRVEFTASSDGATFSIWGGDGTIDYSALAALGTVTAWGTDRTNESEDISQSAVWDSNGDVAFQSGENLWEDPPAGAPGDAWSVTIAAGDCPVEPTGNTECWQDARVIPARFTLGDEEVWLYPGQEATVDGMRIVLLRGVERMNLAPNPDKCGGAYSLEWFVVPAPLPQPG